MDSLGTVWNLVTYLNENRVIFEKQRRANLHMQRVMGMLSQQNMEVLEKQFELYPKGLQLPTFIYLMKKLYVAEDQVSEYEFVSDLIKFFQAIDINGDGHLQWSQFTQYIIENIRRSEKPKYKNKTFEENQIISSAYSKISNQYKITKVVDVGCNNLIRKVVFTGKTEQYFVLQENSNTIKVFDKSFVLSDSFATNKSTGSSNCFIVDFSFDRANQIFGCIFMNSLLFCNMKVKSAMKFINQCDLGNLKNFNRLQFLTLHKLWCSASKNGEIRLTRSNYSRRTQVDFEVIGTVKLHESMITQILQIEDPNYICTSSMDGNIKMYSFQLKKSFEFQHISDQTKSIINGKFRKGVLGIDYTREFGSYVLSYGFSTAIYIYSLDISMTKGYTGNYNEHSGTLLTAKFLKSFPYVLSFDDKLTLRIWDYRKFQSIQVINCEKHFINPSRLEIIPELSECLICEKKITQFRAPALDKKSKQINQFHHIFDFKLDTLTNSIYVFSSNDVRVYDYLTGSLKQIFTKLNQNRYETNITAAQFGHKARKFFVGDAAGFVRQYCSETGDFIQEIRPQDISYQNKAIVRIIFLRQHSLLICCSLDGRVLIYQRNQDGEYETVRDIRDSHEQLSTVGASGRYCLLATGGDDGSINVWGIQKFNIEGVILVSSRVLSLCFSPIHPVLFSAQENGTICIFYVKPCEKKQIRYQCIAKLSYHNLISFFSLQLVIDNYIPKQSCLRKMSNNSNHMLLIIGNKQGKVQLIDINQIISELQIQQNHQLFSVSRSIRSEVQNLKSVLQNQHKKILNSSHSKPKIPEYDISDQNFIREVIYVSNGSVQHVNLVKQNSVILTTGPDKKLKVWSFMGELFGSINFTTFKKISWKIPELNFYKKLRQIETTIYSVRLIENKVLSSARQQFVKVSLLLQQYMNEDEKKEYLNWIKDRAEEDDSNYQLGFPSKQRQKSRKNTQNQELKNSQNQEAISPAQFNKIYCKLVHGIGDQLNTFENILTLKQLQGNTLKLTAKQKQKAQVSINKMSQKYKRGRNSPCVQQNTSQQKQYQELFGKQMVKKSQSKTKNRNMLSCSLADAKRTITAMERLKDIRK